jgi:hypothetical protein
MDKSLIIAVLFLIAGGIGATPVNARIAWVLIAIAGALMLAPL